MFRRIQKLVAITVIFCLVFEQSGFAQVAPQMNIPAYLTGLVSAQAFRPMHLRSLTLDEATQDVNLLLDKGDAKNIKESDIKETTRHLLDYFLIGLRLPDSMFWVNLRPDSDQDIIDPYLEKTEAGRILLEADLQLKKDLAKLTSPRTKEGKAYWDKLYTKAESMFGQEDISIPTLTRPWIVPGEILIKQSAGSAYVYKATLKVMLEQDYIKDSPFYGFDDPKLKELNEFSSQLIRSTILPQLTREVNSARRYAALRQVYYSLVLAQWFKQQYAGKNNQYASKIDTKDLTGLISARPWSKARYYKDYQRSFKDGEYDVEETQATAQGLVIRRYFSGGIRPVIQEGALKSLDGPVTIVDPDLQRVTARPVMSDGWEITPEGDRKKGNEYGQMLASTDFKPEDRNPLSPVMRDGGSGRDDLLKKVASVNILVAAVFLGIAFINLSWLGNFVLGYAGAVATMAAVVGLAFQSLANERDGSPVFSDSTRKIFMALTAIIGILSLIRGGAEPVVAALAGGISVLSAASLLTLHKPKSDLGSKFTRGAVKLGAVLAAGLMSGLFLANLVQGANPEVLLIAGGAAAVAGSILVGQHISDKNLDGGTEDPLVNPKNIARVVKALEGRTLTINDGLFAQIQRTVRMHGKFNYTSGWAGEPSRYFKLAYTYRYTNYYDMTKEELEQLLRRLLRADPRLARQLFMEINREFKVFSEREMAGFRNKQIKQSNSAVTRQVVDRLARAMAGEIFMLGDRSLGDAIVKSMNIPGKSDYTSGYPAGSPYGYCRLGFKTNSSGYTLFWDMSESDLRGFIAEMIELNPDIAKDYVAAMQSSLQKDGGIKDRIREGISIIETLNNRIETVWHDMEAAEGAALEGLEQDLYDLQDYLREAEKELADLRKQQAEDVSIKDDPEARDGGQRIENLPKYYLRHIDVDTLEPVIDRLVRVSESSQADIGLHIMRAAAQAGFRLTSNDTALEEAIKKIKDIYGNTDLIALKFDQFRDSSFQLEFEPDQSIEIIKQEIDATGIFDAQEVGRLDTLVQLTHLLMAWMRDAKEKKENDPWSNTLGPQIETVDRILWKLARAQVAVKHSIPALGKKLRNVEIPALLEEERGTDDVVGHRYEAGLQYTIRKGHGQGLSYEPSYLERDGGSQDSKVNFRDLAYALRDTFGAYPFSRQELKRQLSELSRKNPKIVRLLKAGKYQRQSRGAKEQAAPPEKTGGIDLRALPVVCTQPGVTGAVPVNPALLSASLQDLDQFWNDIQKKMCSGPMPYAELKEFATACRSRDDAGAQLQIVNTCMVRILKMEECAAVSTAPEFAEVIAVL